ncbi:28792_t:CDS:1, partial [Racocetra persica]
YKEVLCKSSVLDNVKQWVLKIKMTPEISLKSVLTNMIEVAK